MPPATVSAVAGAHYGAMRGETGGERWLDHRWMREDDCTSYLSAAVGQDFGKWHGAPLARRCPPFRRGRALIGFSSASKDIVASMAT